MTIHTKKQTRKLTGYLAEVLEEMIDRGYSPDIVNIELHYRELYDTIGTISYNSEVNMWRTAVKGKGVVYISPGIPYSVGSPDDCVAYLDRELTNTKDKAKKLVDDMLKKAEEEDIPYEMIKTMLEKSTGDIIQEEEKSDNKESTSEGDKPNWKDAPEWAEWLAQNKDGFWWWFEEKPEANPDTEDWRPWYWTSPNEREMIAGKGSYNLNWTATLEERPN